MNAVIGEQNESSLLCIDEPAALDVTAMSM
jgi:hypothetical protein